MARAGDGGSGRRSIPEDGPRAARRSRGLHYQQAAEKALKGLLVARGVVPPHIHDLRALLALCPPGATAPPAIAEALTPFAVLARYPGFGATPGAALLDDFDSFVGLCVALLAQEIAAP